MDVSGDQKAEREKMQKEAQKRVAEKMEADKIKRLKGLPSRPRCSGRLRRRSEAPAFVEPNSW